MNRLNHALFDPEKNYRVSLVTFWAFGRSRTGHDAWARSFHGLGFIRASPARDLMVCDCGNGKELRHYVDD